MSLNAIRMRKVQYGSRTIEYSTLEKEGLKSHYITVERHSGVVLKGKPVSPEVADKLILKRANWILNKLEVVGSVAEEAVVTGSRINYLGRSYYVEVIVDPEVERVVVEFNYSRFKVFVARRDVDQIQIKAALDDFYKQKAIDKIKPRVEKLASKTKLPYSGLRFVKMQKRWGSCTGQNKIMINTDAVRLPYSLIDYLIIHELSHTKVKDHSKAFWAELSKHLPNWKALDERMKEMKL